MTTDNGGITDKEERILEAAISVFSQKGYNVATTKDVALEAGVAEGTIFRYYKTKKDLLHGILLSMIKTMGSKIALNSIETIVENADGKEPREVIREVLNDRIKLIKKILPMARILISEALFHEDIREALYDNVIINANSLLLPMIATMQRHGTMRDDMPPGALLRMIIGNLMIFISSRELFPNHYDGNNLDAEFEQMFEIMMNGFTPRDKA